MIKTVAMNDKLNTQDIIDALAQKHDMNKKEAAAFIKELFLLIEHALEKDKIVKLKGLGAFKIIKVNARESINVNTGERFTIQEHNKIGFIPDAELRNLLNKPFAHFETVVLENTSEKDDIPVQKSTPQDFETVVPENTNEKDDIPVQKSTPQNSKEKIEESLNKRNNNTPNKKSPFITCGIAAILLGCIILYMSLFGNGQLKKTALPATVISSDTTKISPVDRYSMEEDLRILKDTSLVNPDSISYTIIGTKTAYTIKKGETLTRVSLRFYGTKDLWPYIQKYNHSKIKNPGIIIPGMVLTIPELKKKDE
jgi:nucleoid DNA-binding protein